ncbi:hypothetical protein HDU91_002714, partial [Kappamyces sp. JEL0680]
MKSFWESKSREDDAAPEWKTLKGQHPQDKDIIGCSVKSITIHGRTIHQVELTCKCCQGHFVVRAAHECSSQDENEAQEAGLEWLQDQSGENR